MNTAKFHKLTVLLTMVILLLAACGPQATPVPPSPTPSKDIQVINTTEINNVTGQIIQTKVYNQCESGSPFRTQFQFSESNSQSDQKEFSVSAGISGEAKVSVAAEVAIQASVAQKFASINTTQKGYQEIITIEVPARTQQEYTIIWRETRREGSIEYSENGETKYANYSYRVGLELASSSVKDLSCLATVTPSPTVAPPTQTPQPEPTAVIEKFISDGCISSATWKIASTDQDTLSTITTKPDGCYDTGSLGLFPDRTGILQILDKKKRTALVSGMYTPINNNSVIEFKIHVNSMYIANTTTPVFISFAVASLDDPLTAKNTARFKLQVEDLTESPLIYFVLADTGENNGAKFPSQHYEYGRTYTIRLELTGSIMSIYVNNTKLNESLAIPAGSKVFYIGYNLPAFSGIDAEVTSINIDGVFK
jgi:hypothetical protein